MIHSADHQTFNIFSAQWIFQVPVKGGRVYITPQEAIYKWYISGIYCQLGDYILPTTLYRNQKIPLISQKNGHRIDASKKNRMVAAAKVASEYPTIVGIRVFLFISQLSAIG